MKLLKHTVRLFVAATLIAAPLTGFAEDKKMDEPALMQPVKSVYDSYLKIQAELANDSIKGVDANANAIAKAVKGDEMKMLSPDVAKTSGRAGEGKGLESRARCVQAVERVGHQIPRCQQAC